MKPTEPVHDAPEAGGERPRAIFDAGFSQAGGEPELLPCEWCKQPPELCGGGEHLAVRCATNSCLVRAHGWTSPEFWNTRVSQPADWLKDKEIKRLTDERNQLAQQGAELWERANIAQAESTPADGEVARALVDGWTNYVGLTEDEALDGNTIDALVDDISTALAEARRAQGTCTWTCEPNPDIEMWETDCGNAFQFEADGPTENKMKFCCYCGKTLVEAGKKNTDGD